MRARALAEARAWIGTPYQHQASVKGAGCDCLGLVRGVWRALYGAEPEAAPPYRADWAETGGEELLLEAAPSAARVRFVEDAGEYQAASAIVAGEGGEGGTLQIELPVVAGRPLAERVGREALAAARALTEEATVWLAPETALRLEPGDRVRLKEGGRAWRVLRVEADESPRAVLAPCVAPVVESGGTDWRPGPVVEPAAAPLLWLLDLPGIGADEGDARPLLAVAGEPWRPVEVAAGPNAAALRVRARAAAPATVGRTLNALKRGPLHRISAAELTVRIEGGTLQSRTFAEVAAGANAIAVRTPSGEWEIVQLLEAVLVAPETWRLRRLLRGQAGTDAAVADVTPAGADVVVLDEDLVRAEVTEAERGLRLVWRAAAGAGPATETSFAWRALARRPLSPVHLKARRTAQGLRLSWIRRARTGGDSWEGEPPLGEEREGWRVEVMNGEIVVRVLETDGSEAEYPSALIAEDFGGAAPNPLRVCVRQASAAFGWGAPAVRDLWH